MKNITILLLCPLFCTFYLQAQTGVLHLPATGQTVSYYPGDDGDLETGISIPGNRFFAHGNGTLSDSLTGLIWVSDANLMATRDPSFDQDRTSGDGDVNWKTALDYIALLNNGNYLGYNDWRLPNVLELRSLVNLGISDTALPANHPFSNLQDLYWSSTTSEKLRSQAVGVFLQEHYAHANIINPAGEAEDFFKNPSAYQGNYWKYYVLPVRGSSVGSIVEVPGTGQRYTFYPGDDGDLKMGLTWPTPRLTDNNDETVTDRLTGLMWIKNANLMLSRDPAFDTTQWVDGAVPWITALEYVHKLNNENYLGFNDWRLPNRNELASLVDFSEANKALPERSPFVNLTGYNFEGYYWTSTSRADETDQAWILSFHDGLMGGGNALSYVKTRDLLVWPVRTSSQGLPTASITGIITLDGNPYPRAEVKLDGPVSGFIRTNLNGEFEFTHLPNGTYTIKLEHKYARFDPDSCIVTLNNDTTVCNFSASYTRAYGWVEISENLFPVGEAAGGCFSDLWFIGNEGWITNGCLFKEIYHTTDGGNTWEVQTPLGYSNAIYMLSADTGYAGGESGILCKTIDGGQNWNFFGVAPSQILSIGFSPDETKGFCGGFDGYLSEITPTGLIPQATNFTDWSAISFGSADYGWAVSCFGRKMIYENGIWTYYGGAQYFPCFGDVQFNAPETAWLSQGGRMIRFKKDLAWQTFYENNTASLLGIFTLDTNHVWAVTSDGDILYTNRASDDTVHFAVDNVGGAFLIDIFSIDEHHAWAIGNNGSLYRYGVLEGFPAGKAEIIDVTADYLVAPAQVNFANRTVSILLADSADLTQVFPDIYISAGATIDPPSGVMQDFSNPITYTVTSENQQIVNSWTIVMAKVGVGFPEIPMSGIDLNIFPNPTNGNLTIRWENAVLQPAKLRICDILGNLVYEENLPGNLAERKLNLGTLPPGHYLVELQTNNARAIRKLVFTY